MFKSHDFLICRLCERFASRASDDWLVESASVSLLHASN
eukprot:COSAG01_NODE_41523_length_450_cov_1.321937_1_plen_38_part_01